MNAEQLLLRLRELCREDLPPPGAGSTPARFDRLIRVGEEDLSLAKLAEAHWDAVAILREAGREPQPGAVYAVWASEIPGQAVRATPHADGFVVHGHKPFCSGLGLVDRALCTVIDSEPRLLDLDMHDQPDRIHIDTSSWATEAFRETRTGALSLDQYIAPRDALVGPAKYYLDRPGFWHGACGPAACWVGGASGLVAYARSSRRADPHTLAHLGGMDAILWMMRSAVRQAASEIDASTGASDAEPSSAAMVRALRLRHVVEQGCTDILRRLTRAYGPHPLAMDAAMSRRYLELDLYLRQTHAERDLEQLGRLVMKQ